MNIRLSSVGRLMPIPPAFESRKNTSNPFDAKSKDGIRKEKVAKYIWNKYAVMNMNSNMNVKSMRIDGLMFEIHLIKEEIISNHCQL